LRGAAKGKKERNLPDQKPKKSEGAKQKNGTLQMKCHEGAKLPPTLYIKYSLKNTRKTLKIIATKGQNCPPLYT